MESIQIKLLLYGSQWSPLLFHVGYVGKLLGKFEAQTLSSASAATYSKCYEMFMIRKRLSGNFDLMMTDFYLLMQKGVLQGKSCCLSRRFVWGKVIKTWAWNGFCLILTSGWKRAQSFPHTEKLKPRLRSKGTTMSTSDKTIPLSEIPTCVRKLFRLFSQQHQFSLLRKKPHNFTQQIQKETRIGGN